MPEVVAWFEIALGRFEIGFLAKRSHLVHIAHHGISYLYIPVSGLGTIGHNAQGDDSIGIAGVAESFADDGAEEADSFGKLRNRRARSVLRQALSFYRLRKRDKLSPSTSSGSEGQEVYFDLLSFFNRSKSPFIKASFLACDQP